MGLAIVLQKVMHGSHITYRQSIVRQQQKLIKVSSIKSPTQEEPARDVNMQFYQAVVSSSFRCLHYLYASILVIKLRIPVLRMGLSGKEKEIGELEEQYLRLQVSSSRVYANHDPSIIFLAAFSESF